MAFSKKKVIETIDSLALMDFLIIQLVWKLYMLTLMLEMNPLLILYKEKKEVNCTSVNSPKYIHFKCGINSGRE